MSRRPKVRCRLPPGLLGKATANRYLKQWGYDHERMTRPPAAVRFQAEHSNALWHFDLSPSDLKQVDCPPWVEPGRGAPTLMIYSVVDDRSGVAYQEYHCVYGEDVEAGLRFLFNAMARQAGRGRLALPGHPGGDLLRRRADREQRRVPPGDGASRGRDPAASARRQGRTTPDGALQGQGRAPIPDREGGARDPLPLSQAGNRGGGQSLAEALSSARYNAQQHRSEPHSRIEDWLANLPEPGVREMCTLGALLRLRARARATPGRRRRPITVDGTRYEVDADLAGETVLLWWGLFDQDLYVEHGDERYGPYHPVGGPIPLYRYRQHRKGRREQRADRVAALAAALQVPRAVLDGCPALAPRTGPAPARQAFVDPDPFREFIFSNRITAKLAIAAVARHAARPAVGGGARLHRRGRRRDP